MPTWNTATDWNNAQSESGVVHESTANTDHDDATIVKQGYTYGTFDEISPTPTNAYPLHEDSGSTAYDVAGTNDGGINGATIGQTGILGATSYSFDGSDDYVSLGSQLNFGGDDFTIVAWFKSSSLNGTRIMSNYDGATEHFGLNGSYQSSGEIGMLCRDSGGDTMRVNSSGVNDDGNWHHAAGVRDGDTVKLWIDGTGQGTDTNSNVRSVDTTEAAHIGSSANGDDSFNGDIAEVRVYDQALSSSEIQTLYDVVNTTGSLTTATKSL